MMPIRVARTIEDVAGVIDFLESDTWEHAREFLAAAPTDPFADHLRWLEEDGRPVACVQVFLHQYAIGEARLGMCLPEYPFVAPELRGRGYFKALMADLFRWMVEAGHPLAYDHGRKGLYTRLGFAPCFHHCMVLIRTQDALEVRGEGVARTPTAAEVAASVDRFRQPFALGRGLQCRDELWRPDPEMVRIVKAGERGEVEGFVVLDELPTEREPRPAASGEAGALTITDSWARDAEGAAALLRSAGGEAQGAGLSWIRLNCRREDPLARLAVLAGGELRWSAGQERDDTAEGEDVDAFYLAELRLAVKQLLPELRRRWQTVRGERPRSLALRVGDEEVVLGLQQGFRLLDRGESDAPRVTLSRKAMARAVMGYATPTELCLLHEGCHVPESCRAVADALFPAREPHLIHEGLAFAKPSQFGLVP